MRAHAKAANAAVQHQMLGRSERAEQISRLHMRKVWIPDRLNPEFPLESAMIAQGFEFTVDSSEGAHTWVSLQPRKIRCGLKEQARACWLMEILG
jgi:hypothetical protein